MKERRKQGVGFFLAFALWGPYLCVRNKEEWVESLSGRTANGCRPVSTKSHTDNGQLYDQLFRVHAPQHDG